MELKTLIFILQFLTVSGEYFFLFFRGSYNKSVDACKENGLQLVNIKTNEINRRVSAYLAFSVPVWSGLHYNASLSKFQWGDGEILPSAGVLPWQNGHPDLSQGKECVYMRLLSGSCVYKMASCQTSYTPLCAGEPVGDVKSTNWPAFERYTKRNHTVSNQASSRGCVFERRGISAQTYAFVNVDTVRDCAVMCYEDAKCVLFSFIYINKTQGGCILHKQIPD